jgi:hypothetical protein
LVLVLTVTLRFSITGYVLSVDFTEASLLLRRRQQFNLS